MVALVALSPRGAVAGGVGGSDSARFDSAPARVIYTPTAFVVDPGRTRLTLTDLVLFGVEHSFDDLLQIDFQANLPIFYTGGSMWVKSTVALSSYVRIGAYAVGSLTWVYDLKDIGGDWWRAMQLFGGGVMASFGTEDFFANLSLSAATFYAEYGMSCPVEDDDGDGPGCSVDSASGRLILPGAGMSWRPGGGPFRFGVEASNVVAEFTEPGRVWVVLPGIRLNRERWFVEYFAVLPFFPGAKGFYQIMPLGVPMFSVGWH